MSFDDAGAHGGWQEWRLGGADHPLISGISDDLKEWMPPKLAVMGEEDCRTPEQAAWGGGMPTNHMQTTCKVPVAATEHPGVFSLNSSLLRCCHHRDIKSGSVAAGTPIL